MVSWTRCIGVSQQVNCFYVSAYAEHRADTLLLGNAREVSCLEMQSRASEEPRERRVVERSLSLTATPSSGTEYAVSAASGEDEDGAEDEALVLPFLSA